MLVHYAGRIYSPTGLADVDGLGLVRSRTESLQVAPRYLLRAARAAQFWVALIFLRRPEGCAGRIIASNSSGYQRTLEKGWPVTVAGHVG